ncbi:hypothetical protein D0Z06_24605 [Geodermatophilus marinus]|nr:hypothetical protein D0Z06_24605 [Geodermatophilus sp. LHW52908]
MTARGVCAVCGTERALRRDGAIREHRHDYHRCHGSGWAPAGGDGRCDCGKPAAHLSADPDSAAWGCRVPSAGIDGRPLWAPLPRP